MVILCGCYRATVEDDAISARFLPHLKNSVLMSIQRTTYTTTITTLHTYYKLYYYYYYFYSTFKLSLPVTKMEFGNAD